VLERGADLGEGHAAGLQDKAERVGRPLRLRYSHHGTAHVASAHFDETLRLEDAQGFSQRRLADSELLHEFFLFGEQVAVVVCPGQDAGS